jgi:predicted PurR-regulated permease PerM
MKTYYIAIIVILIAVVIIIIIAIVIKTNGSSGTNVPSYINHVYEHDQPRTQVYRNQMYMTETEIQQSYMTPEEISNQPNIYIEPYCLTELYDNV